jgi:hypothetical protein
MWMALKGIKTERHYTATSNIEEFSMKANTTFSFLRPTLTLILVAAITASLFQVYGQPAVEYHSIKAPKKLLIYYGYPSLFNGSENIDEAVSLFNKYDIVVLGDGLEWENHTEHENTIKLVKKSKAVFYGYLVAAQPIEAAKRAIDAWAATGVQGVFLDEFGFDYIIPKIAHSAEEARRHQKELLDYARSKGLMIAVNFWFPEDAFREVGGIKLNLTNVAVTVEHAIYGFGEKKEEYIRHYYAMVAGARAAGSQVWCIVSTSAKTSYENKLIGYDALTYIFRDCDAVAIQEDYAEDSNVFYSFAEAPRCSPIFKGVNVPLWPGLSLSLLSSLLERLHEIGFNAVQFTVYYEMPSPKYSIVIPSTATVTDDFLRESIRTARKIGLKVFLRIGLIVQGSWPGEVQPSDPETWFKSYREFALKYAGLAEEEKVDAFVIGTELTLVQNNPRWRSIVKEVREIFYGPISYSANWGSEATIFTDMLDFIGVDAYYPILNSSSWDYIHSTRIAPLMYVYGKPVVFLEIGYRSVSNAGLRPWDWEMKGYPDEELQAKLWEIFFTSEYKRLCGFFHWGEAVWLEGPTGYSILGKKAQGVFENYLSLGEKTQNSSPRQVTQCNCAQLTEELQNCCSQYNICTQNLSQAMDILNQTRMNCSAIITELHKENRDLKNQVEELKEKIVDLEKQFNFAILVSTASISLLTIVVLRLFQKTKGLVRPS